MVRDLSSMVTKGEDFSQTQRERCEESSTSGPCRDIRRREFSIWLERDPLQSDLILFMQEKPLSQHDVDIGNTSMHLCIWILPALFGIVFSLFTGSPPYLFDVRLPNFLPHSLKGHLVFPVFLQQ
ncbi:hypothetical protein NQZ68_025011 [Dissostichus eleginoides]|nr:hypothetical protein NQZ68_025011 [Dissostichus eleginoides]